MFKGKFEDIVLLQDGFLRGPFGSALKKSLFVSKAENTYKVYEQGVVLQQDKSFGNYYISGEYFEKEMSRFEVKSGDFLVSCSGVNYGAIFQLKGEIEQGVINQALLRIRLNQELVDANYFLYYFKAYIVKKIIGGTGDSTIPNFPPMAVVKAINIELPDIEMQKKVGKVLAKIDDKIQINNMVSNELESMAKTIYDYWFLQFDFPDENGKPYKSSGGRMVWNEELKREIPEGWSVGNLYDIADFINGLACQKFRPISNDKKLPVIKIAEMHDGITSSTEFVRDDIPEKHIISDGDILFSWSATLETMIWFGGKAGLNQHIFKVIPKNYEKYYVYMQLSAYIINFVQMAEARKTTMGHINTDHIKQSRIILPPQNIVSKYNNVVNDAFSKIVANNEENREMKSLRDFLLPLLMNGQVGFRSNS